MIPLGVYISKTLRLKIFVNEVLMTWTSGWHIIYELVWCVCVGGGVRACSFLIL